VRKKLTVESPQGHAAGRDMQVRTAPEVAVSAISGGTNIFGIHGDVHVSIGAPPRARARPNLPPPGPEHIGEDQKRTLQDLCKEWVDLHNAIKRNKLTYASAWSRVNKAAGSRSYHYIRRECFDTTCAYIRREMAMLRNMGSAPAKDLEWRSKRIGAIKARCNNQLGTPDAYKAYIARNFKAASLTELATDELQKTYAYIMAKKA